MKIDEHICRCDCHVDGIALMHCFPCCNYTYQKYYDTVNGVITFNVDAYKKLTGEYYHNVIGEPLLTREEFKKQVFTRDNDKCIFCDKDAVDAHHIFDRKLYTEDQEKGGYYISNGVSVCEFHHMRCETTDISVADIARNFGSKLCFPAKLDPNRSYDKWGNEIEYIDGEEVRLPGPLFDDHGVQKILHKKLHLFI